MAGISSMTPREFCDRWPDYGASAEVVLLDVREPHELAVACLDGTTNIPMARIPERVEELARHKTIVVMCHSGVRSMQVAGYLARQGFEHVVNLDGGIDAWSRDINPDIPRY